MSPGASSSRPSPPFGEEKETEPSETPALLCVTKVPLPGRISWQQFFQTL